MLTSACIATNHTYFEEGRNEEMQEDVFYELDTSDIFSNTNTCNKLLKMNEIHYGLQ